MRVVQSAPPKSPTRLSFEDALKGTDLLTDRAQNADFHRKQQIFADSHQVLLSELVFGKGMRTATFHFSESGGSLNRPDLFTELPFL